MERLIEKLPVSSTTLILNEKINIPLLTITNVLYCHKTITNYCLSLTKIFIYVVFIYAMFKINTKKYNLYIHNEHDTYICNFIQC